MMPALPGLVRLRAQSALCCSVAMWDARVIDYTYGKMHQIPADAFFSAIPLLCGIAALLYV